MNVPPLSCSHRFTITAALATVIYLAGCSADEKPEQVHSPQTGEAAASIQLSPHLPLEITVTKTPPTLESLQHDFDVFSWQSFIALNWPAKPDGSPDTDRTIGDGKGGPVVWQQWKESRDLFLPDGRKPPDWNQPNQLPDVCRHLEPSSAPANRMELTQVGKTPNLLDESEEPFQTGPLIDQNGQYTRYAILTNETMFNYVLDNELYSKKGQKAFDQDADFPSSNPKENKTGSIMLKAAWIKMGGQYDPDDFHTREALVYNNPDEQPGVEPACSLEQVGLVGFHIAHKTEDEPQWVWSTFEHVANAPTKDRDRKREAYNFFDPDCKDCDINEPPARPWNPGTPHSQPTQVERVTPITREAQALNKRFHAALEAAAPGSVWTNYELVSTQWPTDADSKTDPTGAPAPSFLANTTLETYIQGHTPQGSSNCMGCHGNAADTNGRASDFTYLLQRAR
ncbi:hypothetical protein [Marinimicrobium locisalis]|uniref:hypothetical protein n=1 Tax=Marinimicrobium locisalis TaxID=546022 RepID=UPI0032215F25